jgi:hypothetical protein
LTCARAPISPALLALSALARRRRPASAVAYARRRKLALSAGLAVERLVAHARDRDRRAAVRRWAAQAPRPWRSARAGARRVTGTASSISAIQPVIDTGGAFVVVAAANHPHPLRLRRERSNR